MALSLYSDDLDRTAKLIAEMSSFGVFLKPIKFRHSRADYNMEKETNSIYKGLASLKYMNSDVSESLYNMKDQQFDSFIDLLSVFPGNSRQREILIKLNFFEEFGKTKKLLRIAELFDLYNNKKIIKKDKNTLPLEIIQKYAISETEKQFRFEPEGMTLMLTELCSLVKDEELPILTRINAEQEYLGYISLQDHTNPTKAVVLDIDTRYKTLKIKLYKLSTGEMIIVKLKSTSFEKMPFPTGAVIDFRLEKKNKWKKENDQWIQINEYEDWLSWYNVVEWA